MKFFLKLKHWQLFLFTWGIPFAYLVLSPLYLLITGMAGRYLFFTNIPVFLGLSFTGTLIWIWAIATGLHPHLPNGVNMNIKRFRILFTVPVLYFFLFTTWFSLTFFGFSIDIEQPVYFLIVVFIGLLMHTAAVVIMFWGVYYAAKTLKSVELQREAKITDMLSELFLIYFNMIGFWILQPRINKMVASISESYDGNTGSEG